MTATAFNVIIPARYGSERLPGKPLRPIAGRPMIAHVLERAMASGAARVIVATDDPRIAEAARAAGGEAVLTRADHETGTDRIAEVVTALALPPDAIVVNLQGDEPLMPPALLTRVAEDLAEYGEADITTVAAELPSAELDNPNAVKVVCDHRGFARYFSRAPIPYPRGGVTDAGSPWRRHLGIYAYRAGFLVRFPMLAPPPAETLERLEQLRALHYGHAIHVIEVAEAPEAGVDTEADIGRVEARLRSG